MTEPLEPAPGAPADTPVPTAPPTAPPAATPFDPASLTPEAQAWLKSQVDAADLKARTGSKANAAAEARQQLAAEVAKALGIAGEEPPDPAELTKQIAFAQDQAWTAHVELQVFRAAPALGADPGALLDSMSFIASLDDLSDLDPRSAEFKTQLEAKVQAAAARYPAKTGTGQAPGPRPDPSQGARGATRVRATSLTEAIANQRKAAAG